MQQIITIGFAFGMATLALWRKELPLYIIASIVLFFCGAKLLRLAWDIDNSWEFGLGVMTLAAFCIYRAVMQAFRGNIRA